jgi:hypothetical protein
MRLENLPQTRARLTEEFTDPQEVAALAACVCSLPRDHPLVTTMITAVWVRWDRDNKGPTSEDMGQAVVERGITAQAMKQAEDAVRVAFRELRRSERERGSR